MRSIFVSFATTLALLAGDGLAGNVLNASADPAGAVFPAIDVPAPQSFSTSDVVRRGGRAARIELDDAPRGAISAWYRLAYIDGGTRLQVFEHYAITSAGAGSDMVHSQSDAWRLAIEAVGRENRSTTADQIPKWARVHTGGDVGSSAGLMFTLAYIDALTPGALVGNLRVAGTGGIGPDGVVTPADGVDAKVAAALLTRPDVVFATSAPKVIDHVTIVESQHTRLPTSGYTVGEWLNVSGFEEAGRIAAGHPGTLAVVVVHDLRQALAWLCGRTADPNACSTAQRAAQIPIGVQ